MVEKTVIFTNSEGCVTINWVGLKRFHGRSGTYVVLDRMSVNRF